MTNDSQRLAGILGRPIYPCWKTKVIASVWSMGKDGRSELIVERSPRRELVPRPLLKLKNSHALSRAAGQQQPVGAQLHRSQ